MKSAGAWRRVGRTLAVLALALTSLAHVGSPNTFFAGTAGPYPVRVTVRLPGVIPGRAEVVVRLPGSGGPAGHHVTVRAAQWNVGLAGAPPAETAAPVPGDPELYSAELWFMTPTAYQLHVSVDGPGGAGSAVVPMVALATAQRDMTPGLGIMLALLGLFLVAGMLTIVGSAVRESVLPPGAVPDVQRRWRARGAVAAAAVLVGSALWGGWLWWGSEAASYGQFVLYRPFAAAAESASTSAGRTLTFSIRDSRWTGVPDPRSRFNALMPDHGKLMHLFLVREPLLDAFAHLHPVPRDATAADFDAVLPPLQGGRYRVYADIAHESGYTQTMVTRVEVLANETAAPPSDPDDSWFRGDAAPESGAAEFAISPEASIIWRRGPSPIVAGDEHLLEFAAVDRHGNALDIEPYMGMQGHVIAAHEEGSVFVHLHPAGSVSMAVLQRGGGPATDLRPAASIDAPAGQGRAPVEAMTGSHAHGAAAVTLAIPFAFPQPGRYRLWVQMKHRGQVLTGAFSANVLARGAESQAPADGH
jgi:hypothetical protein